MLTQFFRVKVANLCLRASSIRTPIAPPRTPCLGVHAWVRDGARGEARGRNCARWLKVALAVDGTSPQKPAFLKKSVLRIHQFPCHLPYAFEGRHSLQITQRPAKES